MNDSLEPCIVVIVVIVIACVVFGGPFYSLGEHIEKKRQEKAYSQKMVDIGYAHWEVSHEGKSYVVYDNELVDPEYKIENREENEIDHE